jgi:hypothetical protein
VTTTDVQLRLRPPLWARAWVVVFPFVFAWFLLFVVRPDEGPVWVGALLAFVLSPLLAWRMFRLAAIGTADGRLVVRNLWRTTTVRREDIAEVAAARAARGSSSGWAVHVGLRTGAVVRLDVTQVPLRGPLRRRLAGHVAEVREWVSGRPQPFL